MEDSWEAETSIENKETGILLLLASKRPLSEKMIQMTGKFHLDKYFEY
jgi:hypothetical protein